MFWGVESKRDFCNISRNTPEDVGPGSYDIDVHIGNAKKMKAPFGVKTNREIFSQPKDPTPAPGEYEAKPLTDSISVTSVFHSRSNRSTYDKSITPSPVDHATLTDWNKKKKKERYKKPKPKNIPITPYFGQETVQGYTTNENGEWVPIKQTKKGNEWIGPGTYTPKQFSNSSEISMHGIPDREIWTLKRTPGPGEYTPRAENRKLKTAIAKVGRRSDMSPTPFSVVSPSKWVNPESSSSVFKSKSSRESKIWKLAEPTPSPAAYNKYYEPPPEEARPDSCFGHRMDRKMMSPLTDSPGPGAYNRNDAKWIHKYTATRRAPAEPFFVPSDTPGPGQYEAKEEKLSKRPNSALASKTKRNWSVLSRNPAPTDYSPHSVENTRIATAIRETRYEKIGDWIEASKKENPSPDLYQSLPEIDGPAFIPRTGRDEIKKENFPGPGAYNVGHRSFIVKSRNAHMPHIIDQ